jgi:prepilin peptidase CpaA
MDLSYLANKLVIIAAVLLTLLAMHSDLRKRIIANKLTLPAIAVGVLLNTFGNGWHGLLFSILGLIAGIGIMLLPWMMGGMGGGDVKFMGALGALLGGYPVVNIFLYSAIAGGVFAMAVAIYHKTFIATLKKVWAIVCCVLLFKTPAWRSDLLKQSISIPYGLAIGAGTFFYLIVGKVV